MLDFVHARRASVSARVVGHDRHRLLDDHRARVDPLVHEVHGDAGLGDARPRAPPRRGRRPGKAGRSDGWTLMTASKRSRNAGRQQVHVPGADDEARRRARRASPPSRRRAPRGRRSRRARRRPPPRPRGAARAGAPRRDRAGARRDDARGSPPRRPGSRASSSAWRFVPVSPGAPSDGRSSSSAAAARRPREIPTVRTFRAAAVDAVAPPRRADPGSTAATQSGARRGHDRAVADPEVEDAALLLLVHALLVEPARTPAAAPTHAGSIRAPSPSGSTRARFPGDAAARDVRERADVGRRPQRAARRPGRAASVRAGDPRRSRRRRSSAAHEREAVRVQPGRREPEHDVARRDPRSVHEPVARHEADAGAGEVELAVAGTRPASPRSRRRGARSPASRQTSAAPSTSCGDVVEVERVRRDVVEEEERLGARS